MAGKPGSPPVRKSEDYLLERRTQNDLRDRLKTMVAFANTVRPGHVATILIGERDRAMCLLLLPDQLMNSFILAALPVN